MRAANGEHAATSKALRVRRLDAIKICVILKTVTFCGKLFQDNTRSVALKRLTVSKIRKPPAAKGEQEVRVSR